MTTHPNATALQHFFAQLYPDVKRAGWSCRGRTPTPPTPIPRETVVALRVARLDADLPHARRGDRRQVERPGDRVLWCRVATPRLCASCLAPRYERWRLCVPGLWFDLDLAYGQHAASTLPTTDTEALDFLSHCQRRRASLSIAAGGCIPSGSSRSPISSRHLRSMTSSSNSRSSSPIPWSWPGNNAGGRSMPSGTWHACCGPQDRSISSMESSSKSSTKAGSGITPGFDWLLELPTRASTLRLAPRSQGSPIWSRSPSTMAAAWSQIPHRTRRRASPAWQ